MIIKLKSDARKILANNIVYFRLEHGWSQEDFADRLGTTPTYVSNLENAKEILESTILITSQQFLMLNYFNYLKKEKILKIVVFLDDEEYHKYSFFMPIKL